MNRSTRNRFIPFSLIIHSINQSIKNWIFENVDIVVVILTILNPQLKPICSETKEIWHNCSIWKHSTKEKTSQICCNQVTTTTTTTKLWNKERKRRKKKRFKETIDWYKAEISCNLNVHYSLSWCGRSSCPLRMASTAYYPATRSQSQLPNKKSYHW